MSERAQKHGSREFSRRDPLQVACSMLDTLGAVVWEADPDLRIRYVNETAVRILGFPQSCWLDEPDFLFRLLHPDEHALTASLWRAVASDGRERSCMHRMRTQEGPFRWFHTRVQAQLDPSGHIISLVAMMLDANERRSVEHSLIANIDHLQTLLDQVPAFVWTADRDLVVTSCTGSGLGMLGLSPEFIEGTSLYDYFHTTDPTSPAIAPLLGALAGERLVYPLDWDGRHLEVHVLPYVAKDGAIIGILGLTVDVTQGVEATKEHRRNEVQWHLAMSAGHLIAWELDLKHDRFRFPIGSEAIYGLSSAQSVRTFACFLDMVMPEDRPALVAARQQAEVAGSELDLEYRVQFPDGQIQWYQSTAKSFADGGPSPRVFGVTQMITKRKELEAEREAMFRRATELADLAECRASELQAILDNMVEPVLVVDPTGQLTLVNPMACQVLGLDQDQPLPTVSSEAFPPVPITHWDGTSCIRADLSICRALNGEIVVDSQERICPQGSDRCSYVLVSAAPIHKADGTTIGAVALLHDVTPQRELELFKDRLVKLIAHELRTPAAIVNGYAQLLKQRSRGMPPDLQRIVEGTMGGARRIAAMVRDVDAYCQLQLGGMTLTWEPVDLGHLVDVEVAGMARASSAQKVVVTCRKPCIVRGDSAWLRYAITALLENARRLSPPSGQIDVDIHPEHGTVMVVVRDHGEPIPAAVRDQPFEPFAWARAPELKFSAGLGVGMHLAQGIAKAHHGQVSLLKSEIGNAFALELPVAS